MTVSDINVYYLNYTDNCVKLQNNLYNKISQWRVDNNLPLNASKCNMITFSRKISPILSNLDDVLLNRPNSVKDLGKW